MVINKLLFLIKTFNESLPIRIILFNRIPSTSGRKKLFMCLITILNSKNSQGEQGKVGAIEMHSSLREYDTDGNQIKM